ncbi:MULTISPECIES: hypothetical protein [Leptospirillum]|jgi:hypothetical protein|uniref:Uncharacterized protein n=3 Tax=Leptospirillum ferriphilum TaxID=178606 RepID=A0A059Y2R7_9BACT|nr:MULTISPECIES: hypothetical protein [Leptospirillum]AFS53640.1 hypothetical protein LFML04_1422 [Leptospirillum ferriphilum ML-04]EAY55783.1 MAG: conserved hypothetical protein [Leptospirillum rubarum]EIJ75290.1 MAG: hypothetical protein C75L2_00530015 [Leptospirillum sp. Group II 'C75']AIA31752.1 hypothetical protein Y981_06980 [Leptospirillum ferriphilum YSK]AKS23400.1 hypothetical protein ABH19_06040 [Leptospirillum sp. Group II 'CF-1']
MTPPKIPRGVLDPPRIGGVRVPLDLAPFFLLIPAGFFFGLSIGTLLVMTGGMALGTGILRKKGDGFMRGWILWQAASRHHLWRPPSKKEGGRSERDV